MADQASRIESAVNAAQGGGKLIGGAARKARLAEAKAAEAAERAARIAQVHPQSATWVQDSVLHALAEMLDRGNWFEEADGSNSTLAHVAAIASDPTRVKEREVVRQWMEANPRFTEALTGGAVPDQFPDIEPEGMRLIAADLRGLGDADSVPDANDADPGLVPSTIAPKEKSSPRRTMFRLEAGKSGPAREQYAKDVNAINATRGSLPAMSGARRGDPQVLPGALSDRMPDDIDPNAPVSPPTGGTWMTREEMEAYFPLMQQAQESFGDKRPSADKLNARFLELAQAAGLDYSRYGKMHGDVYTAQQRQLSDLSSRQRRDPEDRSRVGRAAPQARSTPVTVGVMGSDMDEYMRNLHLAAGTFGGDRVEGMTHIVNVPAADPQADLRSFLSDLDVSDDVIDGTIGPRPTRAVAMDETQQNFAGGRKASTSNRVRGRTSDMSRIAAVDRLFTGGNSDFARIQGRGVKFGNRMPVDAPALFTSPRAAAYFVARKYPEYASDNMMMHMLTDAIDKRWSGRQWATEADAIVADFDPLQYATDVEYRTRWNPHLKYGDADQLAGFDPDLYSASPEYRNEWARRFQDHGPAIGFGGRGVSDRMAEFIDLKTQDYDARKAARDAEMAATGGMGDVQGEWPASSEEVARQALEQLSQSMEARGLPEARAPRKKQPKVDEFGGMGPVSGDFDPSFFDPQTSYEPLPDEEVVPAAAVKKGRQKKDAAPPVPEAPQPAPAAAPTTPRSGPQQYQTLEELAAEAGVSPDVVKSLASTGVLRTTEISGSLKAKMRDLQAALKSSGETPATASPTQKRLLGRDINFTPESIQKLSSDVTAARSSLDAELAEPGVAALWKQYQDILKNDRTPVIQLTWPNSQVRSSATATGVTYTPDGGVEVPESLYQLIERDHHLRGAETFAANLSRHGGIPKSSALYGTDADRWLDSVSKMRASAPAPEQAQASVATAPVPKGKGKKAKEAAAPSPAPAPPVPPAADVTQPPPSPPPSGPADSPKAPKPPRQPKAATSSAGTTEQFRAFVEAQVKAGAMPPSMLDIFNATASSPMDLPPVNADLAGDARVIGNRGPASPPPPTAAPASSAGQADTPADQGPRFRYPGADPSAYPPPPLRDDVVVKVNPRVTPNGPAASAGPAAAQPQGSPAQQAGPPPGDGDSRTWLRWLAAAGMAGLGGYGVYSASADREPISPYPQMPEDPYPGRLPGEPLNVYYSRARN